MATYYWIGGSGTWDNLNTTNWSASSGGAGGVGPPLAADDAIFDANSGTAATVTVVSSAAATTVTVNKSDITLDFTSTPTFGGTFTLTSGTMKMSADVTMQRFSSNNSNARTIEWAASPAVINLTGNNATIWDVATATNLTFSYTGGDSKVSSTYTGGTGTRTVQHGSTAGASGGNAPSFFSNGAATDTLSLQGHFGTVDLAGFTGTLSNDTRTLYGNWTNGTGQTNTSGSNIMTFASSSAWQSITSAGKQMQPFTINGSATVQLADNYTVFTASSTACTLTAGGLELLSSSTLTCFTFSVTGTTARTLNFGTGKIVLTGNGTTIWLGATLTNLTVAGTPLVETTYSGGTGTRTINHGATAGGSEAVAISVTNTAAATDTLSLQGHLLNVTLTAFTGTFSNNTRTLYGNWTNGTGQTNTSGSLVMTFAKASGTQTVTSAGKQMQAFTVNGAATTVQLVDAYTMFTGVTTTTTLTAGTLDLSNQTLTIWSWTSTNTNTRSIAFGTGKIVVLGNNGTVWSGATLTNFTLTGTPNVEFSYAAGVGTRTINHGGTAPGNVTGQDAIAINVAITAGSDTTSFTTNGHFNNINFTGYSGANANTFFRVYGNVNLGSTCTFAVGTNVFQYSKASGTQTITSNGRSCRAFALVAGASTTLQLVDNYTVQASSATITYTTGILDLNGKTLTAFTFTSNNTNTRTIAFGATGKVILFGTAATLWNIPNTTNLTLTGTTWVEFTTGGVGGSTRTCNNGATAGAQAQAINFYVTGGSTDIVSFSGQFIDVAFTGVTCSFSPGNRTMYGNLTFAAGMTPTAATSTTITFAGTTTQTLTTNGVTLNSNVSVNNVNCTLSLADALTIDTSRSLNVVTGTFTTNDNTVTAGSLGFSGSSTRTLNLGNSTLTATAAGNSITLGTHTGLTFNFGANCVIAMSSASAKNITMNQLLPYPTLNNSGAGAMTLTVTAPNTVTIRDLTATYASGGSGATTITLTAGATYVVTSNFSLLGSSGNLVTLNSSTPGTQAFMRKATPWYIGANSVIGSNASGFDPQTVAGYTANFISVTDVNAALSTGQDGFFMFLG